MIHGMNDPFRVGLLATLMGWT